MLAAGSDGGRMLASGSVDDIMAAALPECLFQKPCGEGKPWAKANHTWSWAKARQGARAELKLAHEHGLLMRVEPV